MVSSHFRIRKPLTLTGPPSPTPQASPDAARRQIRPLRKTRNQLWDKNGFWLLLKRLEADRFIWPRREQPVIELSVEQLEWLLDGINLDAMKRHPKRSYRTAG
ncbi:IS66 family insertion sequence element accessory protein TnpB [Burkholderia latens]|uniref:IS66 family insertion sequence element accessory protein TnpB n=2 Tax=Burkholderia TaxID=32008 RepID=UPI00142DF87B|nr:IS66 family insertion sequence element accessory protein TnpB [Burkholderia latens]